MIRRLSSQPGPHRREQSRGPLCPSCPLSPGGNSQKIFQSGAGKIVYCSKDSNSECVLIIIIIISPNSRHLLIIVLKNISPWPRPDLAMCRAWPRVTRAAPVTEDTGARHPHPVAVGRTLTTVSQKLSQLPSFRVYSKGKIHINCTILFLYCPWY